MPTHVAGMVPGGPAQLNIAADGVLLSSEGSVALQNLDTGGGTITTAKFSCSFLGNCMRIEMTKSVSNLEDHVGYWLRFVSNHASRAFTAKVETEGVTVAEWVVLRKMFDHSSVNPSQLAERLALSRGAVSKLIDRLVAKDLVEKQIGKAIPSNLDGRCQTVELTTAGRKLVPKLVKLADKNESEFFGHLSTKQKMELVLLLKEIVTDNGWKEMPTK